MHEIVTLQFGQQANYLGTHFWNAQESYFTYDDPAKDSTAAAEPSPVDHDVHFRPGVGADGSDTFMPRAVIYDLKGAFGSLRKINALYEAEDEGNAALWPGATITHRAPAIPPSQYQQALDTGLQPPALTKETVRYWSDYSRVYYHPKGLIQLQEYELQSQLMPFEGWAVGDELFDGLDKEHDLPDRDLRPFIEECDQLQGLQVLSSVDDAWGGFSSRYVERLRDDFGKLPIWVWGLEDEEKKASRDRLLRQLANQSLSLHALASTASAYIPLSAVPKSPQPRYLRDGGAGGLDPASRWHTAALQAALLETATLPSRLRDRGRAAPLAQMEAVFDNGGNRRVVEARMSVGEARRLREALDERVRAKEEEGAEAAAKRARKASVVHEDEGDGEEEEWDVDMSRLGPEEQIVQMMQRGRRGGGGGGRSGGGGGKKTRLFGRAEALRGAWQGEGEVAAMDQRARDRFAGAPMVQRYTSPLLFPSSLDSYPHIFSFENHNTDENLAVRTALSTSSATSGRLRAMGMLVGRLVGIDQREELSNGLKSLADEYEEGWDSGLDGEDSEDDDE